LRPFALRVNDTGGDLAGLVPPPRRGRRRTGARARTASSDAVVGGTAGADGAVGAATP